MKVLHDGIEEPTRFHKETFLLQKRLFVGKKCHLDHKKTFERNGSLRFYGIAVKNHLSSFIFMSVVISVKYFMWFGLNLNADFWAPCLALCMGFLVGGGILVLCVDFSLI